MMPMAHMDLVELLQGRMLACRGYANLDRTRIHPGTNWQIWDKSKLHTIAYDYPAEEVVTYPWYDQPEDLQEKIGFVPEVRLEWCAPSWLHMDRMMQWGENKEVDAAKIKILQRVFGDPPVLPVIEQPVYSPPPKKNGEAIQLLHGCAPGDIVCITALVRDIMLENPHRYELHVATHFPAIWENNPYIASYQLYPRKDIRSVQMNYGSPMVYIDNVRLHFITAFHRNFYELEGMHVPCRYPKGDLHLSIEELTIRPENDPYWLVFPGWKSDFTAKAWSVAYWQQVVDGLNARGLKVIQCGAMAMDHHNPRLKGVIDLVGKTNMRQIIQLIAHAEGVVCHVSLPMHVAAAFDKPCIVTAGRREQYWWESYDNFEDIKTFGPAAAPVKVPHKYLYPVGDLPCHMGHGCWRNKIEVGGDDSVCTAPIDDGFGQIIPTCLQMVSSAQVLEAIDGYYKDGICAAL
jgi:hypothetical protein